jgi:three-Cys-motif partner protein
MVKHEFGGEHTELKLDVIRAYLNFYCNALKNQNFETWYIDGFAGTGFRQEVRQTGGLLEGEPIALEETTLLGSASIALATTPPSDHYHFVEAHGRRRQALKEMCEKAGHAKAVVHDGDANQRIAGLLQSARWTNSSTGQRQRAVVFLDPYGMGVRWQTLELLANSQRADVWYLLNLKAVHQQMAKDSKAIDPSKFAALSDIFGTTDWRSEFYVSRPTQGGLFEPVEESDERVGSREDVSKFVRKRLQTLYSYVSEPLPLTVGHIDRYFELYCLSNSKSDAAISLIKKGVRDIITKRAPQGKR